MISDVVCECLVEKKREKSERLKTAGIIAAAAVIIFLCVMIVLYYPAWTALLVVLMIGVVYFAVKLLGNLNVEYEYCFVNGELTVDKILNKTVRKNLMTLQIKNVDKAGFCDSSFDKNNAGDILNYSDSDEPDGAVYLQFRDINGVQKTALITVSEEYILKMKPHFKPLVFREGFKSISQKQ